MPQYVLARHVFVCVQGEHVVFLDVRKDRYFALEAARTAGLRSLVPGWPVAEDADAAAPSGVVSVLLNKGILTTDPQTGKSAEATVAQPVRGDLTADVLERKRIGPLQFAKFVSAAVRARLLLKYRTLETVVERVRFRAERARTRVGFSETELPALVTAFATLRPFFFAAKDACLFDALSLSEFLAGYGLFPNWVFGVQSRPFAAHCWLQLDGVVLNDTIDHVQRYTPIMVV
jgi:hypothetical protein